MIFTCPRCTNKVIVKKNAKKPKYCPRCRSDLRTNWQRKAAETRKLRTENKEIETLQPLNIT